MARSNGSAAPDNSAPVRWPAALGRGSQQPSATAEVSWPARRYFTRGLHAPSPAERIRRPARIGAALEHACLLVGNNGADRAGEPCPVRPPVDLVTQLAERIAGR